MSERVAIELLVEQYVADELKQKGLAEIALRQANAKFKAMYKCAFREMSSSVDNDTVMNCLGAMSKNMEDSFSNLRSLVRSANYNSLPANTLKNMAINVEGLFQMTDVIKTISFLNFGVGVANLATNIVGIKLIRNDLKSLDGKIVDLANGIDKLNRKFDNKLVSESRKLFMQFNMLIDSINSKKRVNTDELQTWLIDAQAFIGEILADLKGEAIDTELAITMLFGIMPSYTIMLSEFVYRYYYSNKNIPSNYEAFVSVYDYICNNDFQQLIQDYLIIEKKMKYSEVLDVLEVNALLTFNGKTFVEDQLELVKVLKTKKACEEYNKKLEEIAKVAVQEEIPLVAQEYGIDENVLRKSVASVG